MIPMSAFASYSAEWLTDHAPALYSQWQQIDDVGVRSAIAERVEAIDVAIEHADVLDSIGPDPGDEALYAQELRDSFYSLDEITAELSTYHAQQSRAADAAALQAEGERASALALDAPMSEEEVAAARSGWSTLNDAMVGAAYTAQLARMDANPGMGQGEDPAGWIEANTVFSDADLRAAAAALSSAVTTGTRSDLEPECGLEIITAELQRRADAAGREVETHLDVPNVAAIQGKGANVSIVTSDAWEALEAHVGDGLNRIDAFETLPFQERWAIDAGPIVGDAVTQDSGWPAFAAALDRAEDAGWDWQSQLPALVEQAELPDRHPAGELYYRLMNDCEAAIPPAPSVADINGTAPAVTTEARQRAELSMQQQSHAVDRDRPGR
jgi:hypothetical protein